MKKAFTIIELLVTTTIITLLISGAAVYFGTTKKAGRDTERMGDALLISKVIDQSVLVSRGSYPRNVNNSSISTMCANEIYSDSNPNKIDISQFTSRQIPRDPNAVEKLETDCASGINGYTYHLNISSDDNLAKTYLSKYVLEIALEREKSKDENSYVYHSNSQAESNDRYIYVLKGPYCGSHCQ